MSCNYAEGLSPYHDKGQLGLEEKFDSKSAVSSKVTLLSKWMNEAEHVVIHTGAGISTAAGIPDFRGPKGVWTLEAKGEKPDLNKDFNEAIPTITHMAITKLIEKGKVKYVVSQNIDGLHLRSNLQRKYLSELHGNMFTEQCSICNRQFVRNVPVPTVGQKSLNKPCPGTKTNGRPCRGRLHDTILDWEHNLPENDLGMADYHSCLADLSVCLGTTMQIVPSGNLPLYTKKHGGKLVIVNLQPTKHDKRADLLIHAYVDEVMTLLMKNLNLKIPKYSPKNDPTRTLDVSNPAKFIEWTIVDATVKKMKKLYEEKCGSKEARKRLEMIDDEDDIPLSIRTFKRKVKDEDDSDLEVVDVVVRPKKTKESSKKTSKKKTCPVYNTTITIKKVAPPPLKKSKFEPAEKITIKKNVTASKTKYEIVTKPKKPIKCEIVYSESDICNDLDMICESDDDEMTNNFTTNFRRYLCDDMKREDTETKKEKIEEQVKDIKNEIKHEKPEGNAKEKEEKCNKFEVLINLEEEVLPKEAQYSNNEGEKEEKYLREESLFSCNNKNSKKDDDESKIENKNFNETITEEIQKTKTEANFQENIIGNNKVFASEIELKVNKQECDKKDEKLKNENEEIKEIQSNLSKNFYSKIDVNEIEIQNERQQNQVQLEEIKSSKEATNSNTNKQFSENFEIYNNQFNFLQ